MYLNPIEFKNEIAKSREEGRITDKLGDMFKLLVENIGHKFHGPMFDEDTDADTIAKCCAVIDYIDLRRKPSWIFNYYTTTVFNNFHRQYSDHYRSRRKWSEYVDSLDWGNLPHIDTGKYDEDGE